MHSEAIRSNQKLSDQSGRTFHSDSSTFHSLRLATFALAAPALWTLRAACGATYLRTEQIASLS